MDIKITNANFPLFTCSSSRLAASEFAMVLLLYKDLTHYLAQLLVNTGDITH